MRTLLCRFLKQRPPRLPCPPPDRSPDISGRSRGQVLVIFGITLLALLAITGLAVDAGSLYMTYGQLKRAVDASAVSAANDFKRGETVSQMENAAKEILGMHELDLTKIDLQVFICDSNADGLRDAALQTDEPDFYRRCPDTPSETPRKLVWVDASMEAPLYFMSLFGFQDVPLRTNAIAEAAQVDVVIVLDVSESMGVKSTAYVIDQFDPDNATTGCNPTNTCEPLKTAKSAAIALVDKLYEGYDRIGLVSYDSQAIIQQELWLLTAANKDLIKQHINDIKLHDDPSPRALPDNWEAFTNDQQRYNPVNPEDRDGDGSDVDDKYMYGPTRACRTSTQWTTDGWGYTLWDTSYDPYGWGGVPCDDDSALDTFDWNGNGIFHDNTSTPGVTAGNTDTDLAGAWLTAHDPDAGGPMMASFSTLSTCTGCGLRVASNLFKSQGRPNAVWVMIMLSDGVVNLSDTPVTAGWSAGDPGYNYKNGFCQGGMKAGQTDYFWKELCIDRDTTPRYCIDSDADTCPPGSTKDQNRYSVLDYAMDMVDEAALTKSSNTEEVLGNNIAIYSIYLDSSSVTLGEYLLRYMAEVGDDGDRDTLACDGVAAGQSCGQYYHAPNADQLLPIFENIASRIYTRITN